MKFSMATADALAAVQDVSRVTSSRSPTLAFKLVTLTAEGSAVTFFAAGEFVYETKRAAEVTASGTVNVFADKLAEILSALGKGDAGTVEIQMDASGDVLTLKSGTSRFRVYTVPTPGEVRAFDDAALPNRYTATAAVIKSKFGAVVHATATEASRYALCAVNVWATPSEISTAATDGRRLAIYGKPIKSGAIAMFPYQFVELACKVKVAPEEIVTLAFSDRLARVYFGDTAIQCPLVEGAFPPIDGVIPDTAVYQYTVDPAAFVSALKQASSLTSEESRGVRFTFEGRKLHLRSRSPEVGDAEIEMDVETVTGKGAFTIAVNPSYLLTALGDIDAGKLTLSFTQANRPLVLTCENLKDYKLVVMPVNLLDAEESK